MYHYKISKSVEETDEDFEDRIKKICKNAEILALDFANTDDRQKVCNIMSCSKIASLES